MAAPAADIVSLALTPAEAALLVHNYNAPHNTGGTWYRQQLPAIHAAIAAGDPIGTANIQLGKDGLSNLSEYIDARFEQSTRWPLPNPNVWLSLSRKCKAALLQR